MWRRKKHENIIPLHFEVSFRALPSSEDLCEFMLHSSTSLERHSEMLYLGSHSRCAKYLWGPLKLHGPMQRLIKMISTPLHGSDISSLAWFVKPSIIWSYFASQFYPVGFLINV